jgi:hypothetical protein
LINTDTLEWDGAVEVLTSIRALYPWLRHVFADGGYAGDTLSKTCSTLENCVAIPPLNSGNKRANMYNERSSEN